MWIAITDGFPPSEQYISYTITCNARTYHIQKEFGNLWEKDTKWSYARVRGKVMVTGGLSRAICPTTRKRSERNRSFGVNRDA
jgi:hypothetical protein